MGEWAKTKGTKMAAYSWDRRYRGRGSAETPVGVMGLGPIAHAEESNGFFENAGISGDLRDSSLHQLALNPASTFSSTFRASGVDWETVWGRS
jgi:hypothetical protein